jgi:hypothetical protein
LSPALPLLFGRRYERSTVSTLGTKGLETAIKVHYADIATTSNEDLQLPFTFDYTGNRKDFGVAAQLTRVAVTSADSENAADLAESFDPSRHQERFASRIRFAVKGTQRASVGIEVDGLGLFASDPNRQDSSEWVSNAFYEDVVFKFRWPGGLRPVGLKVLLTEQRGAQPTELKAEISDDPDGILWVIRCKGVRVGAEIRLELRIP